MHTVTYVDYRLYGQLAAIYLVEVKKRREEEALLQTSLWFDVDLEEVV